MLFRRTRLVEHDGSTRDVTRFFIYQHFKEWISLIKTGETCSWAKSWSCGENHTLPHLSTSSAAPCSYQLYHRTLTEPRPLVLVLMNSLEHYSDLKRSYTLVHHTGRVRTPRAGEWKLSSPRCPGPNTVWGFPSCLVDGAVTFWQTGRWQTFL